MRRGIGGVGGGGGGRSRQRSKKKGRGREGRSEKAVEIKRRLTIYVKVRVSQKFIVDPRSDDSSRFIRHFLTVLRRRCGHEYRSMRCVRKAANRFE